MTSASPSNNRSQGPVQARARAAVEEAPQEAERLGQGTGVADHHAELGLLTYRELRRMLAQTLKVAQEDFGALMEGSAGIGEGHAVAAAIQEAKLQLCLEILDRGRDARLRA